MTEADKAERFDHPLIDRYASKAMVRLFSPRSRFRTWRELWLVLARAEKELGLPITDEQIADLEANVDRFDWERLAALERELRHDVMAHIHHLGELAPRARPIIHLGATSCYVTDNADLILFRRGLAVVEDRLCRVIRALADFARTHRDVACLGYTHLQAAQPVTVGKRACLWLQDFVLDLDEVRRIKSWLPCRGVKGTTGTQASFLKLFDGNHEKVVALERLVTTAIGFERAVPVSGQTYPRKLDVCIHQVMSGIAQSASKFASDVRLLSHDGELGEPRESNQVGSSAMPYKRNPMRSERICSLARYVMTASETSTQTAAHQWLERTLDDSAVRRIAIPESFLACDSILILVDNVVRGLRVIREAISTNLRRYLPFLATEDILMAAVRAGGDRQMLHERIRKHSLAAMAEVESGADNRLLEKLRADAAFAAVAVDLTRPLDPQRFIGRASEQVGTFLEEEVEPRLRGWVEAAGEDVRV